MEKLITLILKRLEREKQLTPQFAGIFDSVKAMPEGYYPAVFFWVDRSNSNAIQITVNKPLVEAWFKEECLASSTKVSEADRLAAIEVFARVALEEARPQVDALIEKAGGLANLAPITI